MNHDPQSVLLQLNEYDAFRLRDAYEGVQVFGATGSGKTSGSGAALARAFLRSGFGGLVCCAKPDERELWQRYAAQTGRQDSLVIIGEDQGHCFNFLSYEMQRSGRGAAQTENLVNLLSVITEIAEGRSAGKSDDPFWERAARQLLRNAVDLLQLADGTVSLDSLARFIADAPQHPAPPMPVEGEPLTEEQQAYSHWLDSSYFADVAARAEDNATTPRQRNDMEASQRYWFSNYATLADRTRSSILTNLTSVTDLLTHGLSWELLADQLTVIPENAFDGFILILDLPLQEYGEAGRIIQGIWKYMFQRAVLRRNITTQPRPVFLWADEAQNFISSFDWQFQAVARSARACTVYLSQNLPNYQARLGAGGHEQALSLLGNFQTKIFHANGDYVTNNYAADTIGQRLLELSSTNVSTGVQGGSAGGGTSQSWQYVIPPAHFATLRKGGTENGLQVEGVMFQGGRVWNATGDTYLPVSFKQQ